MYETVKNLHSWWAYLTLLVLIIAVLNSLFRYFIRTDYKMKRDLRINLFALIFTHIQFLIGLVLYFVSPRFTLWSDLGMGDVMKNELARLYLVEHPFTNILAIAFITIGWSKHKKAATGRKKFSLITFFYGVGLVLLLSRIPWEAWLGGNV